MAAQRRVEDARRLRHDGLEHVREQVSGMGVAEDTPRRLADGGTGGRDDVGVLDLLAHVDQFLSGLPFLRV